MKHSLFIEFVKGQLDQVRYLLSTKLSEYTLEDDALATYRKASNFVGNVSAQDIVMARIIEKLERLRVQSQLNQPLSKDALQDIIGHTLFILAYEFEKNSLDKYPPVCDNAVVG